MPSIDSVQKKNLGFLDTVGDSKDEFELTGGMLAEYGNLFLLNLGKYANKRMVVASGKILSEAKFQIVDGFTLQIILPDYFDYPNEGVQGVKSSKNAPVSPYKFKNFGMNADGRASIKKYIQSGHAKIETVRKNNDKALGIGREKKHLALIDVQANSLIYLIKRFGIKKTSYFTDALQETFKDFAAKMGDALGKDITISLDKLNRHGNNN